MKENVVVSITPKKVLLFFLAIVSFLVFMNIMDIVYTKILGHEMFFNNKWNLDQEKNFPAMYSSLAMIFSSFLLLVISGIKKEKRKEQFYWIGLAIVFFYLAMDEFLHIHENLTPIAQKFFHSNSVAVGWWVPMGVILFPFALLYLKFVWNLPDRIKKLFIVSGTVFVSGAVVMEIIGYKIMKLYGRGLAYSVSYTIEETLEMLGIVLFIYALVSYINLYWKSIIIKLEE